MKKYILALDQGTTSSRAILFDHDGNIVNVAQKEFRQIYPKPGYVEHDPMEIWGTQRGVMQEVLETAGIRASSLAGIGITNQRETTVVWDRRTGKPVYPAIVWQCRRTAPFCAEIKNSPMAERIKEKTGLVVDAYFSATKIKWILENVPGAREEAEQGHLCFGTIDTWLLWNLTRGEAHMTDYSNASRTMLFNIKTGTWDEELLSYFEIPKSMLPKVKSSSEIYAYTHEEMFGQAKVPIAGILGDQQAALFGQLCLEAGDAKNTYGTGCFLLMQTGEKCVQSNQGLLSTIAWQKDGKTTYALEGSVFIAGAVIQWLRDELYLIHDASDTEYFAQKIDHNEGVYLVPAFVGLGAPYWDMYARGSLFGMTRGTNRNHIIRAALESIAYQTYDILKQMEKESGIALKALKVDGGASVNNFLMQFQADILKTCVRRPKVVETTALGVAYMAGLATSFWENEQTLKAQWQLEQEFRPNMKEEQRRQNLKGWEMAISHSRNWLEG